MAPGLARPRVLRFETTHAALSNKYRFAPADAGFSAMPKLRFKMAQTAQVHAEPLPATSSTTTYG
jgi:hypothetical protein